MSNQIYEENRACELTVIIPAGKSSTDFVNLEKSLSNVETSNVKFIIVCETSEKSKVEKLLKLILQYAKLDIEFYDGYYGSPGFTRNEGIKHLKTKFVYFADCDDEFHIESILKSIKLAPNCDVIIGQFQIFDLKTKKIHFKKRQDVDFFSVGMNPGLWRIVFCSELVKNQLFSNLQIGEDQLFLAQIRLFDRLIYYSDQLFYTYYTGNPNSLSKQPRALKDLKLVYTEIKKTFSPNMTPNDTFVLTCLTRLMLTRIKHEDLVKFPFIIAEYCMTMAKNPHLWPKLVLVWFRLICYKLGKF